MTGNIFLSYPQVLQGHRFKAVFLIGFSALAGFLEGIALVCLMPLLNTGLTMSNPHISFFELFHLAWNPADKVRMLNISIGGFFLVGILSSLVKLASEIGTLRLRATIELTCRERLTAALLSMRWSKYVSLKMGEIAKTMSHESYMVGLGVEAIIQLCSQALISLCLIALALGLSPKMTMITLVFGFLTWSVSRTFSSSTKKYAAALAHNSSSLANATDQYFSNLKFIKSFGLTPYVAGVLSSEQKRYAHNFFRTYLFNPLGRFSFESLGIIFIGFIVAFSYWVTPTAFGRIIVFLAVFYRLAPRLMNLQLSCNQVLSIEPSYTAWRERYEYALEYREHSSNESPRPMVSFQELRFDDVSFSYEERSILKNISFTLKRGQTLALVGESGGGKTTLLDLVTGLIVPTAGACALDGRSIRDIAPDAWRSRIGLVMQSSPIFHTSVLQNIVMSDAPPDEIWAEECLRMAHAWEFVERLPAKLHSILGEKGGDLSQGECQRLALARALYRQPLLLILDEATSALDAQSESYILNTLRRIKGSLTILMVSHRLNSVDFADEILLLSDGEVTERGAYAELLGRQAGGFRKMAKLQGIVDETGRN